MCTKEVEYIRSVHYTVPDYGPLRGNGAEAGDVGF